jgi:hypothetical protein
MNTGFANNMRLRGHTYSFPSGPSDEDDGLLASHRIGMLPKPIKKSRKEALQWVRNTRELSMGPELGGTFRPELVSELFWQQSERWETIAVAHINLVARARKAFVHEVLLVTAPADFQGRLNTMYVNKALTDSLNHARLELEKLVKDEKRHPSYYDPYMVTSQIQKTRQKKRQKNSQSTPTAPGSYVNHGDGRLVPVNDDPHPAEDDMDDPDQHALDIQHVYYKVFLLVLPQYLRVSGQKTNILTASLKIFRQRGD